MLVSQAALPHLRESTGNIVTVASISGLQGQPYNSSYCASKGGLRLFMKALAVELAADGIRVNCVDPGGVDTAMSTKALDNLQGDIDYGHFPKMMGVLPGGMMPPVKIAEALAFLASDASSQHHRRRDRGRRRHTLVADSPSLLPFRSTSEPGDDMSN